MTDPGALPKYRQITAERLRARSPPGGCSTGERLPPERDMAEDLGVGGHAAQGAGRSAGARVIERRRDRETTSPCARSARGLCVFRLELVGAGGLPTAEVLSVDRLDKPAALPALRDQ